MRSFFNRIFEVMVTYRYSALNWWKPKSLKTKYGKKNKYGPGSSIPKRPEKFPKGNVGGYARKKIIVSKFNNFEKPFVLYLPRFSTQFILNNPWTPMISVLRPRARSFTMHKTTSPNHPQIYCINFNCAVAANIPTSKLIRGLMDSRGRSVLVFKNGALAVK